MRSYANCINSRRRGKGKQKDNVTLNHFLQWYRPTQTLPVTNFCTKRLKSSETLKYYCPFDNYQQQLDKILSLNPPGVKGWFIVDGVVTLQGEISLRVVVWEPNKTAPVFSKESESVKSPDSDFTAMIPLPLPKVGVYILSTPAQLVKSS